MSLQNWFIFRAVIFNKEKEVRQLWWQISLVLQDLPFTMYIMFRYIFSLRLTWPNKMTCGCSYKGESKWRDCNNVTAQQSSAVDAWIKQWSRLMPVHEFTVQRRSFHKQGQLKHKQFTAFMFNEKCKCQMITVGTNCTFFLSGLSGNHNCTEKWLHASDCLSTSQIQQSCGVSRKYYYYYYSLTENDSHTIYIKYDNTSL